VVYNNSIYRALIGSNGVLTWTSASGPNQWQGTLPEARISMATVQFRGKLYMTGGRPINNDVPQQPQAAVLTSYVEDDLTLPTIGDGGSNFLSVGSALPKPRARHGSVVISATPTPDEPAAAFVYVIAGVGDPNDSDPDDNGSDTVIYGKIGGTESTEQIGFASSGWYYSKPHDTVFDGAQVQEIDWTTVITRTGPAMDIRMDYRTSTASNCDDPNAFNGVNWQALDGTPGDATTLSANGANSVTLPLGATANCFQYRARLTSAGSPPATSPSLLNVSIVVQVPGNPDLKVQTLKETKNNAGKFTGLNIVIQNQSIPPPTQPADIEGGGSFFVDLFVFGPGQTPVTPTLPLGSNPPGDVACVNINKSQMPADGMLSILQWHNTADQTCSIQPKAYNTIFSAPGHYVVIVAVDTACPQRSYGCVNEGTAGGESNNLRRLEFDIPPDGVGGIPDTYVPIIRR
jgi:hypothetical protein